MVCMVASGSGKPGKLRPFPVRENRHFGQILEKSRKMKKLAGKGKYWTKGLKKLGKKKIGGMLLVLVV